MTPPVSSPRISAAEPMDSNLPPLERFLQTLREKMDKPLGQELFVPLWKAILGDCQVVSWFQEGTITYRLKLDSSYEASEGPAAGKAWLLEKEILLELHPENHQLIFPKVKEKFDSKEQIDYGNKQLNAVWSWETHMGSTYTGVGYSLRWDPQQQKWISDNLNNSPWLLSRLASPRVKTNAEALEEWNRMERRKHT